MLIAFDGYTMRETMCSLCVYCAYIYFEMYLAYLYCVYTRTSTREFEWIGCNWSCMVVKLLSTFSPESPQENFTK